MAFHCRGCEVGGRGEVGERATLAGGPPAIALLPGVREPSTGFTGFRLPTGLVLSVALGLCFGVTCCFSVPVPHEDSGS